VNQLIECIPNFSEGRRPDVIAAIVAAITGAAPVQLLDTSSDADHNRTVVTFVGSPEAVEVAAYAGIKAAADLIDMDAHTGEHPRMGATDVCPFVPIRGVSMAECVVLARKLGARVGAELNIPVYLYKEAATRPDRYELPDVRKGEYEGIREAVKTDPNRHPDYGPATLGRAGATAIGARPALVAYNVYLNTGDVKIAKDIAKAIRFSGGGLRYLQASGFLVDGRAQVSMNLLDHTKTPLHRVQEMIHSECRRYGVSIVFSELVGLIPEAALTDAARWYLQLDKFSADQILEHKLTGTGGSTAANTPDDFIASVAAGTATPGGGAVAGLIGALAAALPEMVAKLTIGKKKYAEAESEMLAIVTEAEVLRRTLTRAVQEDSAAYDAVMKAFRIDKDSPERDPAIQQATITASDVPLRVMETTVRVLGLIKTAAEKGNINAVSDAGAAAHAAIAAIEAAALNVRINAKSLTEPQKAETYRGNVAALLAVARALHAEIVHIVETRGAL
jgi:glutamate formiminotransferase / formiminotetrahydrofolate cyclodeaminase